MSANILEVKDLTVELDQEKIIHNSLPDNKKNMIIVETLSSLNPDKALNYFHSAKSIIVHRDPRDSYVNLISEFSNFFPKKVEHFIKLYRDMQINSYRNSENKNILRINFEDLLFKYEETRNTIFSFLDIKESGHKNKHKYFDPKISVKNYKIWEKHDKQDEIDMIYNALKEYTYKRD